MSTAATVRTGSTKQSDGSARAGGRVLPCLIVWARAAPSPDGCRARAVRMSSSYRAQPEPGDDEVDPETWAGAVGVAHGVAPWVRIGRSR